MQAGELLNARAKRKLAEAQSTESWHGTMYCATLTPLSPVKKHLQPMNRQREKERERASLEMSRA